LSHWLSGLGIWLKTHPDLILALLLSLWMAACDLKTRRIPNYLTLGGALAGLAFQFGYLGQPGFLDGLAGYALGFGLLWCPICWGAWGPATSRPAPPWVPGWDSGAPLPSWSIWASAAACSSCWQAHRRGFVLI
jgi:hypothetical protein